MNTIPLIFNERQINRTVLGGSERHSVQKLDAALVLLNSNCAQFRLPVLENIAKCGFKEIVSIESNSDNYNLVEYSRHFPFIKFIVPHEKASTGELINIGMSEVSSDFVLVIRDTLHTGIEFITPGIVERVKQQNLFCLTPRLKAGEMPSVPIVFSPAVENSVFTIRASSVLTDGSPTLYPFDFIGFYNRKKFIQLGGFDYTITSEHWQNVDLGFRSWLWGEKINLSTVYSFDYVNSFPCEDLTYDLSYSRFYLKNLLPRFDEDHGVIPKSSFLVYLIRSGCGFIESLNQFSDARLWVQKNRFRFKIDAKYLVENWGKI